ncbi:MAG: hypothetical protein K2Q17_15535 [Nitrospiraceae bacterium]|uniref:hypothetical protein n=1 Tax=Nitrospira cf. moscoviensis SBR1015 TaxID=96242 RepID=UPI000A0A7260|nr:hypothetical protein [Nitrospira cf. moscoviensis SBR1015]MBY0249071.1 hypothetical protein [Nitrospiraceae bacterium]OQW36573.1 MAG: hypothetical protein A4E20_06735 [Nitrospira sp. SG-bin2]
MRKVLALGATICLVGSVGVATAQERLQQSSGGSSLGVGTGVGDVSGSANRVQAFDSNTFLDRLSQPETVMGRIFALDLPQRKLMIETGGAGRMQDEGQEGKAGYGARTIIPLSLSDRSNMQVIRELNVGDEVTVQVVEETTKDQPYGVGRKIVLEVSVTNVVATRKGFGGLGQRPDPLNDRALAVTGGGVTGGVAGSVLPGKIGGTIDTTIGEFTGSAPCWNCEPQPGWGYQQTQTKSDYGTDLSKPNLVKGLQ